MPRRKSAWQKMRESNEARRLRILKMRREGLTLEQIGYVIGLSRQRVHQIIQRGAKFP